MSQKPTHESKIGFIKAEALNHETKTYDTQPSAEKVIDNPDNTDGKIKKDKVPDRIWY